MRALAKLFALASALVPFAAAGQQAEPASPQSLFRDICLADQARLSARAFREASFADLPEGAKAALNLGAPAFFPAQVATLGRPIPPGEVPNRVLARREGSPLFLILPTPDGGGRMAWGCAIVWRGEDFVAARDAVNAAFPIPEGAAPEQRFPTINFVSVRREGADVAAAELNGWTVMRASPEAESSQQDPQ